MTNEITNFIKERNCGTHGRVFSSRTLSKLDYQGGKLVAYNNTPLGLIFIIRGQRKYFAFVSLNTKLYFGGYGYNLTRLEPANAIKLLESNKDFVVVNQAEYTKLNKEVTLKLILIK